MWFCMSIIKKMVKIKFSHFFNINNISSIFFLFLNIINHKLINHDNYFKNKTRLSPFIILYRERTSLNQTL